MKIVPVKPEMTSIPLGRQGENLRTQIVFPVQEWLEEYPEAVIGLINRRPDENTEYPVQISGIEDGTVKWTVGAAELANHGNGECTLIAIEDEVVVKSKNYHTVVFRSLSGEGDAPDPWDSWVEYFIEKAEAAEDAAETAVSAKEAAEDARDAAQAAAGDFQGLTATVAGLPEGVDPQINVTHSQGGLYNLAFKIPKGDQGDPAPAELVVPAVEDWLDRYLDPLTADTPLDRNLALPNAAAPADLVGEILKNAFVQNYQKVDNVSEYDDFDDYLTAGNYAVIYGTDAQTVENIPEEIVGMLSVIRYNINVYGQIYITYTGNIYRRYHTSSGWSAWEKFADDRAVNEKIDFEHDLAFEKTDNLLSISQIGYKQLKDTGASVHLINSNTIRFSISKPASSTIRIPLASDDADTEYSHSVFSPNLPAGTYTLFYEIKNPAANYSNIRFRHREAADVNGTDISSGEPFTTETQTQIVMTLTSGAQTAEYVNTEVKFSIFADEVDEKRYIPRISARDYKYEETNNNEIKQFTETTENIFSFSKEMLNNPALDIRFINNSEIEISGTKDSNKTYRYGMGNNYFNYKIFNPNLKAGTYRVSVRAFTTEETEGTLRVRYRTQGGVNGTNLGNGVYTFESDVEIYVAIPSGQTDFVDYHVRWQITSGSDPVDFIPGGITTIDAKARSMIEQLAFANLGDSYSSTRIAINKQRQPGDMLLSVGSDYHFLNTQAERDALGKYIAFCKSMAMDYLLELGDNVRGYDKDEDAPDLTRGYTSILNSILKTAMHKLLYIVGNHDDASGYVKTHSKDADDFIGDNELRNYYILNSDRNIVKTNSLYYYLDKEEYRIRIIALNSQDIPKENDPVTGEAKYYAQNDYAFRNTQINWLKDALLGTPSGYAIIVLVHLPITREYTNFDAIRGLIKACHHGTSYASSGYTEDFEYSVSADYTGNARKVLCVLCGHTHDSEIVNMETGDEYEGSQITADGIPQITQGSGEENQNALIINHNRITRIAIKNADVTEIDISDI